MMLNKSERSKLKALAHKLAKNNNIKYEEALNCIAREKGHIDWKSLTSEPRKVNFKAFITYGAENIKDSILISLNQIEAGHIIKCCESYIDIYNSLLNENSNIETLYTQKKLTDKIMERILVSAKEKISSNNENCIELEFSGFELGQFITLLYDYGKSIELYLNAIKNDKTDKNELFYLTQTGGIFGDILSRVTSSLKDKMCDS